MTVFRTILNVAAGVVVVSMALLAPAGASLRTAQVVTPQPQTEPALYFGDLHSHSDYSDGNVAPEVLVRQARAAGLDFFALTDHAEYFYLPVDKDALGGPTTPDGRELHLQKWAEIQTAMRAASSDDFLAFRGFEWSSPLQGHANVWLSESWFSAVESASVSMEGLYTWLATPGPVGGADAAAGFNHPDPAYGEMVFNNLAYDAEADAVLNTFEIFNELTYRQQDHTANAYEPAYFVALANGWHLAPIGVSDNHGTGGFAGPQFPRTGAWLTELTEDGVKEAILARRLYATEDHDLSVKVTGEGAWMGSVVEHAGDSIELHVQASDHNDAITAVEVLTQGAEVVGTFTPEADQPGTSVDTTFTLPGPVTGTDRYYVVRVTEADGDSAYAAPLWFTP